MTALGALRPSNQAADMRALRQIVLAAVVGVILEED